MRVAPEPLLTLQEAAKRTATPDRLWRRLVAERRVRYVKVGRYVRIPASAIEEFLDANTVEPVGQAAVGIPTTRRRSSSASPVRLLAK